VQENNLNEIYFYYFFVLKERKKQQAELIELNSAFVLGYKNSQNRLFENRLYKNRLCKNRLFQIIIWYKV